MLLTGHPLPPSFSTKAPAMDTPEPERVYSHLPAYLVQSKFHSSRNDQTLLQIAQGPL